MIDFLARIDSPAHGSKNRFDSLEAESTQPYSGGSYGMCMYSMYNGGNWGWGNLATSYLLRKILHFLSTLSDS